MLRPQARLAARRLIARRYREEFLGRLWGDDPTVPRDRRSDLAGFAAYSTQPGLIAFVHAEVKAAFEGHGVGSILIREALDDARRRGFEVLPFCPFVNSFIAEHREFVDLVPGSRREEFGL